MGFDLFSVDRSSLQALGAKPRAANDREVSAFMRWQRERRGLPNMEAMELHWRTYPGSRWQRLCIGATFGKLLASGGHSRDQAGVYTYTPPQYENGAYSIVMPGHDAARWRVTFEVLDDSGEVVRSQTLPINPKNGGVIWSRDEIRKAQGPVAKPTKRRKPTPIAADAAPIAAEPEAVAVECPEFCQPEAAESDCGDIPALDSGETLDALHGADLPPAEPVTAADELPAPATVKESLTAEPLSDAKQLPDPVAELAARVAALEARLAALPAESAAPPSGEAGRPKRTPAHERAIRRAWAERAKRQKAAASLASAHQKMEEWGDWYGDKFESLETELRLAKNDQALDRQALAEAYARAEQFARRGNQHRDRRLAAARRARRMIAAARKSARFQEQRADVLAAQLAKIKHDMADPTQPECASDLARLLQERDQARTALAATDARNRAMKAALDDLADKFEAMASRLAVAEAAARRGAIAV